MITAKNLTTGYAGKTVLKNLDFSIGEGLTVILGRNGSGKSTLLRSMAGIHPLFSGEIRYDGRKPEELKNEERAKTFSLVLTQKPAMNLQVSEILRSGRYPYVGRLDLLRKEDEAVIDNVVRSMKLQDFLQRNVDELSDGERQKIMIARAVIQDTPVMLLDEPVSHLDLPNTAEILVLLKKLAGQGKTLVFSTHRLEFVREIADQIIVLDNGRAITGKPGELFDNGTVERVFRNEFLNFEHSTGQFKLKI